MDALMTRLHEKRLSAWEQAKQVLEAADADKRDLSGEEETTYQRCMADMAALDERLKGLAEAQQREADLATALRGIEARAADVPADVESRTGVMDDVATQLRSFLSGETRSMTVRPTREEMRDLTKGTASSGGATVPTTFGGMLWAHLIETATVAGVSTVMNTDSGEPLTLPVTTSHSTGALTAENAGISESDPAFTSRTLSAYKYGVLIQVPNELIADTGVDLEGYLAMQAGRAVGNALGVHLATGDGSSKPTGIITSASAGVTGAASVAGAFDSDKLIDLYYSVIGPYRASPKCGWLMRDATLGAVRKLTDDNGQYLWQPSLQVGAPDLLLGKPVHTDPNIAAVALGAKSVAFGDLGAYVTRIVGGVRFESSDQYAFNADQVTFRCVLRGDGILADQTGAVKVFTGNAA